ncbi:MAG: glutamate 5-kinase, partial [Kiritimatiellae bacterium]|nr:glutamate 5-kinase [Kiritimatiellia bacterium]
MRIIVKLGSNVLTRADGRLSIARMAALADEITALHEQGHQVVLVTSGAVAAGKAQVSLPKTVEAVARRQVLSAVGQTVLIDTYRALFAANGLNIGQILVTKNDFSSPEHTTNMRQCIHALFAYGILPVVNENDTVSVESLMFTDNDELAGLLATLLEADQLVILSSVDGLYTGDPTDPASTLIREVAPEEDWTGC